MRVGDPPVGGRYLLVEPFGADERFAGGKVQTWRAQDTLIERDVVLRVLTPGGNSARLFLDRALEMSLIADPGLGMVYEAVDLGEYAIVVSEWVAGISLSHTIEVHGPLHPATARETLGVVADAVAEAHRAGLPIGGITAERVVLSDDASVKITAVPALFADERGDIQQLGELLYAALTGHAPDLDDPELARHLHRRIPRDLATLCQRALDPDPATQLGSAAAFATVLRPRARPSSGTAASEPPTETAGRAGDRLRDLDFGAAAVPTHDTAPASRLPSRDGSEPVTSPQSQALPSVAAQSRPGNGGLDSVGGSADATVSIVPNDTNGSGGVGGVAEVASSTTLGDSTDGYGASGGHNSVGAETVGSGIDGSDGSTGSGGRPGSAASGLAEGAAGLPGPSPAGTGAGLDDANNGNSGVSNRGLADRASALGSQASAVGAAALGAVAGVLGRRGRRTDVESADPEGSGRTGSSDDSFAGDAGFRPAILRDSQADDQAGYSVGPDNPSQVPTAAWSDEYDPWEGDGVTWGGDVDGDDDTDDMRAGGETRRKILLYAVPIVALLLVVLLGIFVGREFSAVMSDEVDPPAATAESSDASGAPSEATATDEAVGPVALPPVSAAVFDPFGDGAPENNDDVGLAYDGDVGTAWQTLQYQNTPEFGNLKPGVGLIFDLGQERTINSVELATDLPGTAIEIRVGAAPDAGLDSYRVVGTLDPFPEAGSVALAEPVPARFVIVWFVRLTDSGGGFRGALSECRFLGA